MAGKYYPKAAEKRIIASHKDAKKAEKPASTTKSKTDPKK